MGFIPVLLNPPDVSIGEPHIGQALELSPPPQSIGLFEIRQIADISPDRDNLDVLNLANDHKFHSLSVYS